jgi:hypothetical protein
MVGWPAGGSHHCHAAQVRRTGALRQRTADGGVDPAKAALECELDVRSSAGVVVTVVARFGWGGAPNGIVAPRAHPKQNARHHDTVGEDRDRGIGAGTGSSVSSCGRDDDQGSELQPTATLARRPAQRRHACKWCFLAPAEASRAARRRARGQKCKARRMQFCPYIFLRIASMMRLELPEGGQAQRAAAGLLPPPNQAAQAAAEQFTSK